MPVVKYWDRALGQWRYAAAAPPATGGGGGGEGGLDQATADGLYVNIAGDTMTGPLVIADQGFGNYGLDVVNLYVRNDLWVDDDLTLDGGGWLTVNGAGSGGFYVEGGFEIYVDASNRAVGFWRKSGASYQPLMATLDYEPATKKYVDTHAPKITVSTTAPSNPVVGEVWIDTN